MQSCDGGPATSAVCVEVVVKVATALRRELRRLGSVKDSTLAGSALALARMLDDPATADTARTAAARELRETLAVLHEQSAPAEEDRMSEFERRARERAESRAVSS